MKDLGRWSVYQDDSGGLAHGNVYFMYRGHFMGQYSGSVTNARYMVACINAALVCWSAIDDEVQAEAGGAA